MKTGIPKLELGEGDVVFLIDLGATIPTNYSVPCEATSRGPAWCWCWCADCDCKRCICGGVPIFGGKDTVVKPRFKVRATCVYGRIYLLEKGNADRVIQ